MLNRYRAGVVDELKIALLGSGSRGNATIVQAGETRVLVDCGFAAKELFRRMELLGIVPGSLTAILVTHEHGDHIRGVGAVARKLDIPVWMTGGTAAAYDCGRLPQLHQIQMHADDAGFEIGALHITPYAVPHDAREPCQYVFRYRNACFGMLTDAGSITPHIVDVLNPCDALLLECNHDTTMLANGPYPYALQQRVGGPWGHLNNRQASELLSRIDKSRLNQLIVAHISEKNNSPAEVRSCILEDHPELVDRLLLASQDDPSGWIELARPVAV